MNKYLEKVASWSEDDYMEKEALITGFRKNRKELGEAIDTVYNQIPLSKRQERPEVTSRNLKAKLLLNAREMAKGEKIHVPDNFGKDMRDMASQVNGSREDAKVFKKYEAKYKRLYDAFEPHAHKMKFRI